MSSITYSFIWFVIQIRKNYINIFPFLLKYNQLKRRKHILLKVPPNIPPPPPPPNIYTPPPPPNIYTPPPPPNIYTPPPLPPPPPPVYNLKNKISESLETIDLNSFSDSESDGTLSSCDSFENISLTDDINTFTCEEYEDWNLVIN